MGKNCAWDDLKVLNVESYLRWSKLQVKNLRLSALLVHTCVRDGIAYIDVCAESKLCINVEISNNIHCVYFDLHALQIHYFVKVEFLLRLEIFAMCQCNSRMCKFGAVRLFKREGHMSYEIGSPQGFLRSSFSRNMEPFHIYKLN